MEYISVIAKEEGFKDRIISKLDKYIVERKNDFFKIKKDSLMIKKLAEIIGELYEKQIILKLIDKKYSEFTRTEKIEIYKKIFNEEHFRIIHLRFLIGNEIESFLKNINVINIDGFIIFRLIEYKRFLSEIIDDTVEKYIVDREYSQFIDLIKIYISMQEPLVDIIHVYKYKNTFKLSDKYGTDITNEYILEPEGNILFARYTEDDELLSILIGISPKQIILHNENEFKNKFFLETLKKIFEAKIFCCN